MKDEFDLAVTDVPDYAVRNAISSGIAKHNRAFVDEPNSRPLTIAAKRSNGDVCGGLWGKTAWGWLNVELLYVSENVRGLGLGKALILTAETEALVRNCWSAWVDTYSFQARAFYERHGYSLFGTLENYPVGHFRFFLQKPLRQISS
jgi:GNAT superfamily N-acetyltransferase